jgi:hypothetical protein
MVPFRNTRRTLKVNTKYEISITQRAGTHPVITQLRAKIQSGANANRNILQLNSLGTAYTRERGSNHCNWPMASSNHGLESQAPPVRNLTLLFMISLNTAFKIFPSPLLLFARHACKIHVQELGEKIL